MRFFKRLLIATGIAIAVGVGLAWLVMRILPGFLFEWRLERALTEAGADIETVEVDGQVVEYAIAGDGEAIVFVHGFAADKRSWAPYVQRLSGRYRIVAADLPGHGGSARDSAQTYTVETMADALARFVDSQDLPRFHLVGISMGGGIALAYALDHPDRVTSLTLLNPWGVTTPVPSDREVELERGHNVFLPETLEALDELSMYVYGVELTLDEQFERHLLEQAQRRRAFDRKVFDEMHAGPRLDGRLAELRPPTLVLVGGADRIVHPSSLGVFRARVQDLEGELLPGCAHVFIGPCFERGLARFEQFLHR